MVDNIEDASIENSNSMSMIRHKIVFIGDVAVGKTSILNRFLEDKFKENYEPSIGVDFSSKNIKYKGKSLKLQIWDSAGQERYRSLIPTYVRGASLIFLVFDVSKRETFDSVANWVNFIKGIENPIIVLIGNKIDLNRKVEFSEAEKLAGKEGLLYFEISAKTNDHVKKAFFSSIAELPFFEQLNVGNKQKLINDLEIENDEKKNDSKIFSDTPNLNKLNVIGSDHKENKSKVQGQCKC